MKALLVLASLIIACAAECNIAGFYGGKFTRCETLTPIYDVYWSINDNTLTIGLNFRGPKVWFGFGISLNGGMRGADIAVAQRDSKGNYYIEDRFVPGVEGMPKFDDHQDTTLLYSASDASGTTVVYTRLVKPCDIDEDVAISPHDTQVIFAYGQSSEFGYHGVNQRGAKTIFFHYAHVDPELPSDAQTINLLADAYEMPVDETTYACTPVELPYDQKYHVVRWRPVIEPGHENLVHHIILFTCDTPMYQNASTWSCGISPVGCTQVAIVWTLGQYGNDWNGDHALPIGAGAIRWGVLQIHYNNPEGVERVIDNSGLAITYTTQLRQYELSSFIVSTVVHGLEIPALHPGYERWAECPTECTQKFPTPITIVNYFPHMHTVGEKIWMQHIRGNVELPEIHRDNHYDFLRQQSYSMNVTILPGDRLRIHCIWNTLSRTNITYGGESTTTEMCSGFLQYYPAAPTFPYCSNFNLPAGKSMCGLVKETAVINIAPYNNFTTLPPRISTCLSDEKGSSSKILPVLMLVWILSCMLLL